MHYWLTIVTFLPLLGAIVLLFLPKDASRTHGLLAMVVTLLTLAVSIPLYFLYQPSGQQFQLTDYAKWVPTLGINYYLGIDGISLLMVLMTTVIFPFVVGVSLKSNTDRTQMFYFLILFVESAILGVFMSLNLVLFYIFYEAMLIPLYFIVGMWGGKNRVYATLKFFLYTMVGSVLMLASIITIYFLVQTFDFPKVQQALPMALVSKLGGNALTVEMLLFLGFFAAFAVKAPIWPLHTWVPDAYTEAPIAGSIILVALKMGLYGFIRFNLPLFPHATATAAPIIVAFAVIGVVYAALVAAVQTDLKRLIAYSSISHVGVVALAIFGLTAIGISGGVIQMVNHTITTGALFILVGLLFARRGTYEISAYGGVWKAMPVFTAIFLLVTLSSVALPGTGGFTGEFLMLLGAFQTHPWAAGIATTAAIWSVVYMLWMFQRVFFGANDKPEMQSMPDVTLGDKWALVPLVLLFLWLGIYPNPVLKAVNQPTVAILSQVSAQNGTPVIPTSPIPDNMGPRPVTASAPSRPDQNTRLAQR